MEFLKFKIMPDGIDMNKSKEDEIVEYFSNLNKSLQKKQFTNGECRYIENKLRNEFRRNKSFEIYALQVSFEEKPNFEEIQLRSGKKFYYRIFLPD